MTRRPYYGKTDELVRNIRGIILTYLMTRFRIGRTLAGCGCLLVAAIGICGLLTFMTLLRP
jgi:hypothetical protein